jgi:hypothetical protein
VKARAPGLATPAAANHSRPIATPDTRKSPAAQAAALRCAQCGAGGSPPTICGPSSTGLILVPVFGARADGGPALVCDACRRGRRS